MKNKILLSTGALYNYGLNRFFEFAARAGYDGIELIIGDSWDNRDPKYIRKLEKEFKIKVLSVHSAMEFVKMWGDAYSRLEKSIAFAKELKAKVLVLHMWEYDDKKYFSWIGSLSNNYI